ncbi:MAG: DUF3870 domain-containing protein [Peptococcaceae bacterium]|nr:DUF3870 domain-containing protein [Peptococcaceae bacterium]MDH7526349.1 DUF3870 domain-containing protein [Peptococcaceae bacterium]
MNKHFFAGQAQMPAGTDVYEHYKYLSILMTVDMDTGKILNCIVPIYCEIHNEFLSEIMVGKSLDTDFGSIIKQIEKTVHTQTKRSLITALQVLYNRYRIVKKRIAK